MRRRCRAARRPGGGLSRSIKGGLRGDHGCSGLLGADRWTSAAGGKPIRGRTAKQKAMFIVRYPAVQNDKMAQQPVVCQLGQTAEKAVLRRLPTRTREIGALCQWRGLTERGVGVRYGINEGSVCQILKRARAGGRGASGVRDRWKDRRFCGRERRCPAFGRAELPQKLPFPPSRLLKSGRISAERGWKGVDGSSRVLRRVPREA